MCGHGGQARPGGQVTISEVLCKGYCGQSTGREEEGGWEGGPRRGSGTAEARLLGGGLDGRTGQGAVTLEWRWMGVGRGPGAGQGQCRQPVRRHRVTLQKEIPEGVGAESGRGCNEVLESSLHR